MLCFFFFKCKFTLEIELDAKKRLIKMKTENLLNDNNPGTNSFRLFLYVRNTLKKDEEKKIPHKRWDFNSDQAACWT